MGAPPVALSSPRGLRSRSPRPGNRLPEATSLRSWRQRPSLGPLSRTGWLCEGSERARPVPAPPTPHLSGLAAQRLPRWGWPVGVAGPDAAHYCHPRVDGSALAVAREVNEIAANAMGLAVRPG